MFDKRNSMIVKGVAIFIMMWHHCFLEGRFENYSVNFWPISDARAVNIAMACKICVSLFAFISGYGLYLSYASASRRAIEQKVSNVSNSKWISERLIRTMSGYWFIVVLCWIVCTIIDQRPFRIYGFEGSVTSGIFNALADFSGIAHLIGTNKLIDTWWYMSAAIVFIVLVPLLYKSITKLGCLLTAVIVFIIPRLFFDFFGSMSAVSFALVFCMGMVFAHSGLFQKWNDFWSEKIVKSRWISLLKFVLMLAAVYLGYRLYIDLAFKRYWEIKWVAFPIVVIMFVNDYLSKIPILSHILAYFGKHSMNIFLVHSFIRVVYCADFIYSMPHAVLIAVVLILVSLVISIVIEQLKKILRYEKFIDYLINKVRSF